jgi:hypothetical protein
MNDAEDFKRVVGYSETCRNVSLKIVSMHCMGSIREASPRVRSNIAIDVEKKLFTTFWLHFFDLVRPLLANKREINRTTILVCMQ